MKDYARFLASNSSGEILQHIAITLPTSCMVSRMEVTANLLPVALGQVSRMQL